MPLQDASRFAAARPVRYLACLIGRLAQVTKKVVPLAGLAVPTPETRSGGSTREPSLVVSPPEVGLPAPEPKPGTPASDGRPAGVPKRPPRWDGSSDPWPAVSSEVLTVVATRQQQAASAEVANAAQDMVRFYTSLLGGCPYPELTVALIERELPGGHSPAYLAILDRLGRTGEAERIVLPLATQRRVPPCCSGSA